MKVAKLRLNNFRFIRSIFKMEQNWAVNNVARAWPLLVMTLVCLVTLSGIYSPPISIRHDIGQTETSLPGLYPPEHNEHFTYAYIRDPVSIMLPNVGSISYAASIQMGGPSTEEPVSVHLETSQPLINIGSVRAIRVYSVFLPGTPDGNTHIQIGSSLVKPPRDARQLGALLDTIRLSSLGPISLPAPVYWCITITLALVWLISYELTSRLSLRIGLLVLVSAGICAAYASARSAFVLPPASFVIAALGTSVVVVTARTLASPDRRAWLRSARWLTAPAAIFIGTRLGILFVAYIADPLMADGNDHGDPKSNIVLEVLTDRWDSAFYYEIATSGYRFSREVLSSVAFFPLLPGLMRGLTPILGSPLTAGLFVTNAALLGAAIFFYRLVESEWGPALAERSVWYLLIFPMSFFGSFLYSESLFLFGAIGALYFARRGHWGLAGCFGALAALSRFLGILVAPMLLIEWWMQRRRLSPDRPPLTGVLGACIVPLGTAAYMLYLQYTFSDPLAFIHASSVWGRAPSSSLTTILALFTRPDQGWGPAILSAQIPLNDFMDLGSVVVFGILGCILLYERRWSESAFVLLGVLIPLNSGLLASQRRYVWVLFPVFVLLARWGTNQWIDRIITALFLLGLGVFTAMIANHYWVA